MTGADDGSVHVWDVSVAALEPCQHIHQTISVDANVCILSFQ